MDNIKSDRGFISGFIGVAIHMKIQHILQHIYIANRCKDELGELKDLVMSIELTIMHIQQNRLAFKANKEKDTASSANANEEKETASAVNEWLNQLDDHLLQASEIVQQCSIPKSHFNFSGCQTKKKISSLILKIKEHLKRSPLLVRISKGEVGDTQKEGQVRDTRKVREGQVRDTHKVLQGVGQVQHSVEALASSATTSPAARKDLIVGQNQAFQSLQKLVIDDVEAKNIGVLGNAGSGKTLILLTAFNSQEVRNHFRDGLLLWLTVSQRPHDTSPRNDLCKQIAIQKKIDLNKVIKDEILQKNLGEDEILQKNLGEDEIWLKKQRQWLNKQLEQSSRFALFLDDVRESDAKELLQELDIAGADSYPTKSKVIVSSRDRTALLNGVTVTIPEPHIVGQEKASAILEKFLIDDVEAKNIGVFCKGGSGKTLLLETLFHSQKVRTHFSNGLLLRITVSEGPSLCTQIARQNSVDSIQDINKEEVKKWLKQKLDESNRFVLFLEDVWERDARNLFQELGILDAVSENTESKVIVSSRDLTALLKMGIEDKYTITIKEPYIVGQNLVLDFNQDAEQYRTTIPDLNQDDSWQLFKHHAFPYNNGNLPSNINEEKAKRLCDKCGGLPRAIIVVGRAMAGSTDPQQWEWALHRLTNATQATIGRSGQPLDAQVTTERSAQPLDACLRLSFDALGNQDFNMQLCFLHIAAAFSENKIIDAQEVIPLWMGEGLLARKVLKHVPQHILADRYLIEPMIRNTEGRPVCLRMQDPFEIGRLYLDLLAERCLIEPTARDADGRVLCFRMLKVVRDLAIAIAEDEENFYCCNHLEDLQKNKSLKIKRIFLSDIKSSSLPAFSSSSELSSLLISQSKELTKIPKKVIGSMLSLKVLDLSGTSASSLPENMGSLKQLICLKLSGMPIKRLPKSFRDLGHLEILDLSFTNIKELPSDIHMLRSLRYLGLGGCTDLQNLPYNISGLVSLQYLYLDGCSMWAESPGSSCKKVASLHSLFDLMQLKKLALQNNWEEAIKEGTLGSMTEIDTLILILPNMVSLPLDINNMSKLRSLSLKCSKLTKMDSFICSSLTEMENKMKNDVSNFKHLTYLKFYECDMLEDFQHLHKLQSLRQLEIILCSKVKKIPQKFDEKEVFSLLKIFSLVGLKNLQELPEIEKGAMSSLEIFNMMDCPKLNILPQTYLNLGIRIRVYGCPELGVASNRNLVQVVAMALDTEEIIKKYLQVLQKKEDWLYGEFWCNELFLFVEGLMTIV